MGANSLKETCHSEEKWEKAIFLSYKGGGE